MAISAPVMYQEKVIICDDSITNVLVMTEMLNQLMAPFELIALTDSRKVMSYVDESTSLLILDIEMPFYTGYDILMQVRQRFTPEQVSVIVVSGSSAQASHIKALKVGANDFIKKPYDEYELKLRVMNQLKLIHAFKQQKRSNVQLEKIIQQRTKELEEATECLIMNLANMAELHDENTGQHIMRVGKFSGLLAKACGLPEHVVRLIEKAAPMHDIGKLHIPDKILFKPGKLTDEEFAIMKTHVDVVDEILIDHPSVLIQMAKSIAKHHHEKWDGTGYSEGLSGQSIPIEGRIVCLVDVFDALTTARPYKPAWPVDDAIGYIVAQSGKQFDPNLVTILVDNLADFLEIKSNFED
ncbi:MULTISPECIES: HD domain-containing phosphohydrolase [unclassified Motilimonas]|uniref:HD-GYP domain-containing protein n=1 Tax=Motilimonas TaxID=1914248 RepID=UPI001E43F0AD|nr:MULTISPECIES: HD domain-containing phosphohydrolase [unclassified Motilimonas]MCE0556345.1 HD domain-containing protein [Motilimonas sp. E26]MDO6525072.1 HD domain-containing protein [Motilimonas sp. 1_MG-2023]